MEQNILDVMIRADFFIVALILNFCVGFIKDWILKIFGDKVKNWLPQILQLIIFILGFIVVFFGNKSNQIPLMENSIWITGGWVSVLSIIIYDIGLKKVMTGLKLKMSKKLEGDGNGND